MNAQASRRPSTIAAALMALLMVVGVGAIGAEPAAGAGVAQRGAVKSGNLPIAGARVTLYATSARGPRVLGSARTRENGSFRIGAPRVKTAREIRYLIAEGGRLPSKAPNPAIRLATVLGRGDPGSVVLNEQTTVATAFALAQFRVGKGFGGPAPGLPNAAGTVRNLVRVRDGAMSVVLRRPPNGSRTSAMRTFGSLANMLTVCVRRSAQCHRLFELTTPRGESRPRDVLAAAQAIATHPAHHVPALFELSLTNRVYRPALLAGDRPDAWFLALRYDGGGGQFDGPGQAAFDRKGNAWITNNYVFKRGPRDPNGIVCGDDHVIRLRPEGRSFPGAPYKGGGLYGAGFGIAITKDNDVWVGNFGFQGSRCKKSSSQQAALSRSVSQFAPRGTVLSPSASGDDPGGWTGSKQAIFRPQGMAADRRNGLWIASCGNDRVVRFRDADPDKDRVMTARGLDKPFAVTVDDRGRAWVTSNGSDAVFAFDRRGNVVHRLTGPRARRAGIDQPMGIASDSRGNIWVSNSGLIHAPCDTTSSADLSILAKRAPGTGLGGNDASMTMIRPNGQPHPGGPFTGAGIRMPWGVAIDGDDNVWVANFDGQRVGHLCGATPAGCPPGRRGVGDQISPPQGYGFDGLVRNTGVSIDPSGNVWLTNNWKISANQINPGGFQMVAFIGLAKPVKTPLVGAPRRY